MMFGKHDSTIVYLFWILLYISYSGLQPGLPLGTIFFFVKNFLIYLCLPSAHFYLTFFYSVETFQYFIEILLTVVCFYLIVDTIFQNFYIHMTSKFCFQNVLL